jgi:histone-lysine N-methyltransferase EZH2
MPGRDGNVRDNITVARPPRERPLSAKSVEFIDLSIDEDDIATSGQITQQGAGAGAGDGTPAVHATPAFVHSDTLREAVLPERTKPSELAQQSGPEPLPSLPMEPSANSGFRTPNLPPSLIRETQDSTQEPVVKSPIGRRPFDFLPEFIPPNLSAMARERMEKYKQFALPENRAPISTSWNSPMAWVLNQAVPPPIQPISNFAGDHRERTTSNCVNTGFERDDARLDSDDGNMANQVPAKAPQASASAIPRPPRKLKAIKSVKRRNDASSLPSVPARLPHEIPANEQETPNIFPARLNAGSSTTRPESPLIARRSQSKDPSVDTNITADIEPVHAEEEPIQTARADRRDTTPNPSILLSHQESGEAVPENDVSTAPLPSRAATPAAQCLSQASVEHNQTSEPLRTVPDTAAADVQISATSEVMQNDTTHLENPGVPDEYSGSQPSTVLRLHADVLITTRSAIEECLKRHVAERHESHAFMVQDKMWRQRTFQEREVRARSRKQKRLAQSTLPEKYIQTTSPFENMSAIQVPFDRTNTKGMVDMSQEVYVRAKPRDMVIKSGLAVSTTKYKSDAPMIPPFKEYVSLRNNILADNESKLLATPYFQDEDYSGREVLLDTLPYIYEMTNDENGPLDVRKEQCRFYKDAIEAFLSEIGITWNDILYWLLAPERNITRINYLVPGSRQFEAHLLERSRYHIEKFERDGEPKQNVLFNRNDRKWREFLPQLKEPSATALRLAATACAAVFQECEFSIWYLAEQSEAVQNHVATKTERGQAAERSTYREIVCRVCHQ